MQFFARLEPDGDGYLVTFPALPEAITGGKDEAEALANAQDALEVVLLSYVLDGRPIPADAGLPKERGRFVRVIPAAAVAAKIAFIEAFRNSGMTRTALAGRLGKGENEVRRMLDPYHATKLQALDRALLALGKRLVVSVEQAA